MMKYKHPNEKSHKPINDISFEEVKEKTTPILKSIINHQWATSILKNNFTTFPCRLIIKEQKNLVSLAIANQLWVSLHFKGTRW